jgi:hypothetical protein
VPETTIPKSVVAVQCIPVGVHQREDDVGSVLVAGTTTAAAVRPYHGHSWSLSTWESLLGQTAEPQAAGQADSPWPVRRPAARFEPGTSGSPTPIRPQSGGGGQPGFR